MSDPLSIAAGVAGLLSLGIEISESLIKFYTAVKEQAKDVVYTRQKLENL
jgi:hypothetical protein